MSLNKSRQKEQIIKMSGTNPKKCMKCGKCSGTCPAYEKMELHPHQFVAMIEKGDFESFLDSDSFYYCMSCMACAERCPRGVEPDKLIEAARLITIRKQGGNHLKPEDVVEIWDENMPQQALVSGFRKYSK